MTDDVHRPGTRQPAPAPKRRRWIQWVIVALLVLIPAGYTVVAAVQSRASSGDKELAAEAAGMVHDWPARTQRSIYRVPIPYNSTKVGYFETNSWQTSSLYVQFSTTAGGLDSFLAQIGTSRGALKDGSVTISVPAAQTKQVGWTFTAGHQWAGVSLTQPRKGPDHHITVNLDNPDKPSVYVVSTVTFH